MIMMDLRRRGDDVAVVREVVRRDVGVSGETPEAKKCSTRARSRNRRPCLLLAPRSASCLHSNEMENLQSTDTLTY